MEKTIKVTPSAKDQLRKKLKLGIHDPTLYGGHPSRHYQNSLYARPQTGDAKHKQ